jgi:hypothetical protein
MEKVKPDDDKNKALLQKLVVAFIFLIYAVIFVKILFL